MAVRDDRRNYVVVGTFVLAVAAALVAWLALLAGRTGDTHEYVVHYRNVLGLGEGTQVYFEGHPAGVIDSIAWQPEQERFEVALAVGSGWRIPRGSVAQITASGLLSAFLIDIQVPDMSRADPDDVLGAGDEIQAGELVNVFALLGTTAGELNRLMAELDPVVQRLTSRTPEVLDDLSALTADLAGAAGRVSALLSQGNADSVERTLSHLESTSASFAQTSHDLGETQERLDVLLLSLQELVDGEQGEVAHAVSDLHRSLESVADHIGAINRNLETTTRNMSEFSEDIRRNPGLLLRGRDVDDGGLQP
jgi:phospholipid/cholesterol/gamma-HCH transport system substrate-binding protein